MKVKSVGLFSGGLDSILACKVLEKQKIEVKAVSFITSFFGDKEKLKKSAKNNKIDLEIIDISKEYFKMLKNPKHGYGRAMNPCIDCKIFMLNKAKEVAKKNKAKFIFTGEVLGQRPMSQRRIPLKEIEKDSGLENKLLRPLCAKQLNPTEAENNHWVDRNKLLDISGRSRKRQLELAKEYELAEYSSPGGGCCLTEAGYAAKLKDLITLNKNAGINDLSLLKIKRHFRVGDSKIIPGNSEVENKQILKLKKFNDFIFEARDIVGPITLLRGRKTKEAIMKAAAITLRYSDSKEKEGIVRYKGIIFNKEIKVTKITEEELNKVRIKQL